jgi:hypothetical protein
MQSTTEMKEFLENKRLHYNNGVWLKLHYTLKKYSEWIISQEKLVNNACVLKRSSVQVEKALARWSLELLSADFKSVRRKISWTFLTEVLYFTRSLIEAKVSAPLPTLLKSFSRVTAIRRLQFQFTFCNFWSNYLRSCRSKVMPKSESKSRFEVLLRWRTWQTSRSPSIVICTTLWSKIVMYQRFAIIFSPLLIPWKIIWYHVGSELNNTIMRKTQR